LFILLEWMGSGLAGGVTWAVLELVVLKWRRRNAGAPLH
jgi:hypothetical protein